MPEDAVTRHFFNGFIRLHILYHAVKEEIYGAEITEELIRHGYRVSQGTLYPTLHLLEGLGYLSSRERVVGGRRRRCYRATAAGRKALAEAKEKLQELIAEIIEDKDEPFQDLRRNRKQAAPPRKKQHRGTTR
jgi:PadR family transcriptional regulator, regulatory protein PadR